MQWLLYYKKEVFVMSEKFNNMSFRTKLLLSYIAVIILCIIIFGLTVFSSISRRFENEITDNNAQITGLAVNNMTNTMNNIEQIRQLKKC